MFLYDHSSETGKISGFVEREFWMVDCHQFKVNCNLITAQLKSVVERCGERGKKALSVDRTSRHALYY